MVYLVQAGGMDLGRFLGALNSNLSDQDLRSYGLGHKNFQGIQTVQR
ncbi:MAG: hypothetical protein HW378_4653 [Anaerolineales bacterium]|nr:hypothetical protein [Anaerolineales bacterium]